MRDLMMLSAFLFMVPLAMQSAFVAYLFWAWSGVLLPNYYLYGFMQSMRFNFLFALMALGLMWMGKLKNKGQWVKSRTATLYICFLTLGSISALLAEEPNPLNADVYVAFVKAMLFCLVMPYFLTSRLRIHVMIMMLGIGLGFHGMVEGLKVIASGGSHHVVGLGGMMSDNNHWGVAMVMTLPLLLYLSNYSDNRLARWGFMVATGVTVISILGSNSRGAFLGMAIIGAWMIMVGRRKIFSLFIVAIAVVAIANYAPESWFSRMQTIENAGADESFMGRISAWKISAAGAIRHPIFGLGFHGIQHDEVWGRYISLATTLPGNVPADMMEHNRAAHSIYFEVLGDLGFVGFMFFLAILFNAVYTRFEIRRLSKKIGPEALWASDLGDWLGVAVVAYMAAGAGVSLGYFETSYAIMMLLEITKQHLIRMRKEQLKAQSPTHAFIEQQVTHA